MGEGREGADAREFGDSPLRRRNGVGGPVGEDRSALRLDQVHADLRSESQMRFSPGAARYAHAASQNLHAAAALDSAMTGGLTGGPEGPISIMQPTHPSHGAIFLAEQARMLIRACPPPPPSQHAYTSLPALAEQPEQPCCRRCTRAHCLCNM